MSAPMIAVSSNEMTLQEQRCLFTTLLGDLIWWVDSYRSSWKLAINEVVRTKAQADANASSGAGISNSLHLIGLAADLLLYIDGEYQTESAAYSELGAKWKSLHPLNRWGGDFAKPDGNHFSSTRDGIR